MGVSVFAEDDCLPISALQHLLYCERQCALIHLEQLWAENSLTTRGRHMHEKADSGRHETRNGVRVVRSLALCSLQYGLIGKSDVVEFHPSPGSVASTATPSLSLIPFPVEYKRGKPKPHDADRVQLCAQALCLEEMLEATVPKGALFYGKTRRRLDVLFDSPLRELTLQTTARLHDLIASRVTPAAVYEKKKCERCSLINLCLPRIPSSRPAASAYLDRSLSEVIAVGAASD